VRSSWARYVLVGATGLIVALAPGAASASWSDGGYHAESRLPHNGAGPVDHGPADYGPAEPLYGCENIGRPGSAPVLHKTTVPPPGTPVLPGQEIVVEITWRTGDWTSGELHKVIDCVYVNDHYAPELTGGERSTPNDGSFSYHYFVPADAPPGTVICDQGFLSGPNWQEDYGREISERVCFPVDHPPTRPPTEVPPTTQPPPEQPPVEQPPAEQPAAERPIDTAVLPSTTPPPEEAPPAASPTQLTQLPRTGGDSTTGRLALASLALAALARRRARRPDAGRTTGAR
jgi:hypothetical protein